MAYLVITMISGNINTVSKQLLSTFVLVALLVSLVPGSAHAANGAFITSVQLNGSTVTTVSGGATVTVSVTASRSGNGSSDDWTSTQYKIDAGSNVCVDTTDFITNGNNTNTATFTITAPLTNGNHSVTVKIFKQPNCVSEQDDKEGNNNLIVSTPDTTAPVISGTPSNITTEATGSAGTTVNFTSPTAIDAVDGTVAVHCVPSSGSLFPLATTLVTCTATDAATNSASTNFNVTVQDTTAPVITLNGSAVVALNVGDTYTESGASATDIVDGNVSVSTSGSVDTGTPGSYTITYSAADAHGNTAIATRTITVSDVGAPIVTVPANIIVEADSASGTSVSFSVSASDDVDGEITAACSAVSGSTFAIAVTTVTCSATDIAGNIGTGAFTITVQDTIAPVITLNGTNPITITVGDSYTDAGAQTADTVDGSGAATASGSVDTATAGTYTIIYSATDAHGNSAVEVTRTVIVQNIVVVPPQDETPPTPTETPAPIGNGGGDGSNNNGPIAGSLVQGQVLGASITAPQPTEATGQILGASCSPLLHSYLRMGAKNDPEAVKKLQSFLNKELGISLEVTGTFDSATKAAVMKFQLKYADEILKPWEKFGLKTNTPTGYVYKTTLRWINKLSCTDTETPMPILP